MRNSTFTMLCWVLRPEMSIKVNQDTIHCAALRAEKSTQAQLSAPRRNIGHLIHRRAAFLAVSWSHHRIQRLDWPNGFPGWQGDVAGLSSNPAASSWRRRRRGLFLLALRDLGLDRRRPKGQSLQASGQDFQLVRRTQVVEMVNARLHDLKVLRCDVVGRDGVILTHGRLRCLARQSFFAAYRRGSGCAL